MDFFFFNFKKFLEDGGNECFSKNKTSGMRGENLMVGKEPGAGLVWRRKRTQKQRSSLGNKEGGVPIVAHWVKNPTLCL